MRKNIARHTFVSVVILIFITNCTLALAGISSEYPKTFTDSENRSIIIPAPVQRVVVLNENAAEAVVILGSGDKIVGAVDQVLDKGSNYPSIKDAACVGSRTDIDYEKIVKVAEKGDQITPDINAMESGDETATSLGVDINRTRMATMTVASLITASIISFTGTIGFIGLVAPHMARIVIGGDNRFLLLTSSLMGALLLLGADAVGRTVFAPAVLPVGLMTSLLGVPLFVYLFMKRRKKSC